MLLLTLSTDMLLICLNHLHLLGTNIFRHYHRLFLLLFKLDYLLFK